MCNRDAKAGTSLEISDCIGLPLTWIFLDWTLEDFQQNVLETRSFALAEFGSIQLEYVALSQRLQDAQYANMTEALLRKLDTMYPSAVSSPL